MFSQTPRRTTNARTATPAPSRGGTAAAASAAANASVASIASSGLANNTSGVVVSRSDRLATTPGPRALAAGSSLLARHTKTEPRPARRAFANTSSASITGPGLPAASFSRPATPLNASTMSVDKHLTTPAGGQSSNNSSRPIPELILLQSRTHKATVIGESHPDAVQYIEEARLDSNALHAIVDQSSGYAAIAVPDRCFVWQYNKRNSSHIVQCLQFPFAVDSHNEQHALVSFVSPSIGGARYTGLVACTADGLVRYWGNISFGPESFRDIRIPLGSNDCVTFLINCEPVGFMLGTQNSSVFRISLFDSNGASHLSCTPMQHPSGMFNRVASLFGYGSQDSETTPIADGKLVCLIPGKVVDGNTACELYVLTCQSLQKWVVSKSQPDRFVFEMDICTAIKSYFDSITPGGHGSLHVRIEDADYTRDDQIAILVGTSDNGDIFNYTVIVCREINGVLNLNSLPPRQLNLSQSGRDAPTLSLALSNGGPFFFVSTEDHIVISTLEADVEFEENLPFTQADTHILGLGVEKSRNLHQDSNTPISAVVVFYGSNSSLVQISVSASAVHADAGLAFGEEMTDQLKERATQILCTKLEQAVFFGSSSSERSNPIAFDLIQPGGDIDAATLHVSNSILNSSSPHIHTIIDTRAQLSSRFHRIDRIISFISTHGLLDKVSLATRFKLSFNAEMISSGEGLWRLINLVRGSPESVSKNRHLLILQDSIDRFMTGQLSQEDPIKDFFEHVLERMGDFLVFVVERVQDISTGSSDTDAYFQIFELNRISMIILTTALEYRYDNLTRYGLPAEAIVETWTASERVISSLISLYEVTVKFLRGSFASLYPTVNEVSNELDIYDIECSSVVELKNKMGLQLCKLADLLIGAFYERISFLNTCGPQEERSLYALKELHKASLDKIIQPLVTIGHSDRAFDLAEKYREFKMLVDLCLSDDNSVHRIRTYLDMFSFDFSDPLFSTYIQREMYRDLVEQPAQYHDHLNRFFALNSFPQLAWIQDIAVGRYTDASNALWEVAGGSILRDKQLLALSLSKLAAVEAADSLESYQESKMALQFDHAQELVILQNTTAIEFMKLIVEDPLASGMDVDKQASIIVSKRFSLFNQSHPELTKMALRSLRDLLRGAKLEFQDTVQLFTMQDPILSEDGESDLYVSAMELIGEYLKGRFSRGDDVNVVESDIEQFYVHLVWRRAWLSGGWGEILSHLRHSSMEQTHMLIRRTSAFALIHHAHAQGTDRPYMLEYLISPLETGSIPTPMLLRTLHPDLDDAHAQNLCLEYAAEQDAFAQLVHECNLGQMYNECVRLCVVEMDEMI
ncbi:hypothetical protein BASA60_006369 [Batrachochytrium salamandrivorans]|nr:hypothetical protein BASA60_006369 [Batrachochytrium salamandrivorans]